MNNRASKQNMQKITGMIAGFNAGQKDSIDPRHAQSMYQLEEMKEGD